MRKAALISSYTLLVLLLGSCVKDFLSDTDYRLDPGKNPDLVIRAFIFDGDSTEFLELPISDPDTGDGMRYNISIDSIINVNREELKIITVGKKAPVPTDLKIRRIYLGLPNNSVGCWRFGPEKPPGPQLTPDKQDVSTMRILVPNNIRAGSVPMLVTALMEKNKLDTNTNQTRRVRFFVKPKTVTLNIN